MDLEGEVEILLVEDDPEDAELTLRALRKNKLANRVVHVTDGAEAVSFIFGSGRYSGRSIENGPRVILLDIRLPGLDGIEVLKRVKADARTRAIPVVMLTSSQEDRDMIESYKLGVNSYIVKPVEFEGFMRAVAELGLYWVLLNQMPRR